MAATLRVAAYNLRGMRDDRAAAARVVRAIAPDVLCLQEVPRHFLFGHRVADFAVACGLYWTGGSRGSGGTTIMTSLRVETLATSHERLAVRSLDQQRGFAWQVLRRPGGPTVGVASLHLSLRAAERRTHVADVLARLPQDLPLVVAGDVNEPPTGRAWKALAARLPVVSADAFTFPSSRPRARIDGIFADPALTVVAGEGAADRSAVVLDEGDLRAATDHRPIWVDLDLGALTP